MKKYHIPTAEYQVFDSAADAMAYVETAPLPTVIKADGLALGKGVLYAFPERQWNVRPSSVCLVHNPSLSCAPSRFRVGVVLEVVVFRGSLDQK